MADATIPTKRIWQAFGITWALLVLGLIAWQVFVTSRAHPFSKSYILGADESDEHFQLSWLAWGHYGIRVNAFDDAPGATSGGDIAVELLDESGAVIVPRRFLFTEDGIAAAGSMEGTPHGATTYAFSPFGFETGLFERFTMRVTTIRTDKVPPRRIELTVLGMDSWAAGEAWAWGTILVAVLLFVSAIALEIIVWIARRACRAKAPSSTAPAAEPPPSLEQS